MQADKIILGIDPGTTIMGYGLIHIKGNKMELIQMGVLHLSKLGSHELKLKKILRRKNPYLFKALNSEQAHDIIEKILAIIRTNCVGLLPKLENCGASRARTLAH